MLRTLRLMLALLLLSACNAHVMPASPGTVTPELRAQAAKSSLLLTINTVNGQKVFEEYRPTGGSPVLTIQNAAGSGAAYLGIVLADKSGTVYAYSDKGIYEYPAGKTTPVRSITPGVTNGFVVVGGNGELYTLTVKGSLAGYPPGSTKPSFTTKVQPCSP